MSAIAIDPLARGESDRIPSTDPLSPPNESTNNKTNTYTFEHEVEDENRSTRQTMMPLWYELLFPMVPKPFTTVDEDEDENDNDDNRIDDDDSSNYSSYSSSSSASSSSSSNLFPNSASVTRFIESQATRLKLLTHMREQLITSSDIRQEKVLQKYTNLHIDVKLLIALSDVFSFSRSALELVHHCTSNDLDRLQRNNRLLLISILGLLRLLMRVDPLVIDLRHVTLEGECRPSAPQPRPMRTNIADRLAGHNSAEIMLNIFDTIMDESNQDQLNLTIVESVLRCINTQLDLCSPESSHRLNLLKHIYLFNPSQLHTPPNIVQNVGPGEGSESMIIRRLIGIIAERRTTQLTILSASILSHIATTPIHNDHRTISQPIVTYPACSNNTHSLDVASKLFLFPNNPSLYLVEKGNLIGAYLDILQPMLSKSPTPPSSVAVVGPTSTEFGSNSNSVISRSLFRKNVESSTDEPNDTDDDDEDEDEEVANASPRSSTFAMTHAPSSPSFTMRGHQQFVHEPHTHVQTTEEPSSKNTHHASFAVSEKRFMLDSYSPPLAAATPIMPMSSFSLTDESNSPPMSSFGSPLPQSLPPLVLLTSSCPPRSAPVWCSNEVLGAAISGLASLCDGNALLALHVVGQPGMVSFIATLLTHPVTDLSLSAMKLVVALERALVASGQCHKATCLVHRDDPNIDSLTLSQYLSNIAKVKFIPRRRRNSFGAMTPNSPPIKPIGSNHTPRVMSHPAPPLMHRIKRVEAYRLISPLVSQSVNLLVDMIELEWGPSSKLNTQPHSGHTANESRQKQMLGLLSRFVVTSDDLQQTAGRRVIPILVRLLADPTQSSSMRECCLDTLISLCALDTPNRQLVIEARVLSNTILPLLAMLKPMEARRMKDRNEMIHPAVLALQLACVRLCTNLSTSFESLASSHLASGVSAIASSTAMCHMLVQLLSYLDPEIGSPPSLRHATMILMRQLLLESSHLREILFATSIGPNLEKLTLQTPPEEEEEEEHQQNDDEDRNEEDDHHHNHEEEDDQPSNNDCSTTRNCHSLHHEEASSTVDTLVL